jgi:hypothetical protein
MNASYLEACAPRGLRLASCLEARPDASRHASFLETRGMHAWCLQARGMASCFMRSCHEECVARDSRHMSYLVPRGTCASYLEAIGTHLEARVPHAARKPEQHSGNHFTTDDNRPSRYSSAQISVILLQHKP